MSEVRETYFWCVICDVLPSCVLFPWFFRWLPVLARIVASNVLLSLLLLSILPGFIKHFMFSRSLASTYASVCEVPALREFPPRFNSSKPNVTNNSSCVPDDEGNGAQGEGSVFFCQNLSG